MKSTTHHARSYTRGRLSFYDIAAGRRGSIWLYVSVDENERIVDVWQRRRQLGQEAALVVNFPRSTGESDID